MKGIQQISRLKGVKGIGVCFRIFAVGKDDGRRNKVGLAKNFENRIRGVLYGQVFRKQYWHSNV